MNFWIFRITWVFVFLWLWLMSFTTSERVAVGAAFLVLIGVIGEELAELKILEGEKRTHLRKSVKRWAIGLLVLGLAGDVVGIVMGQAAMAVLTKEAGDADSNAHEAKTVSDAAKEKAGEASKLAGESQAKAALAEASVTRTAQLAARAETDARNAQQDAAQLFVELKKTKEAEEAELQEAERVRKNELEIQSLFNQSGRALSTEQRNLLKAIPGGNAVVMYLPGIDRKPSLFARSIWLILKDAGWKVSDKPLPWSGETPAPGITIQNKWISSPEFKGPFMTTSDGTRVVDFFFVIAGLKGRVKELSDVDAKKLAVLFAGLGARLENDETMQGWDGFRIVVGAKESDVTPGTNK
jgi:hypothetical protein